MPLRRPSPAFVLAFIALIVAMSGVGYAAIPAKDGDVHLCYSKKTGAVTVVDTKSDEFDCDKNWVGFTFDTRPTQLVSPSGKFKVEATDDGARLVGPDAEVTIGVGTVNVRASKGVDVRSNDVVDVRAADNIEIEGSRGVSVKGATGVGLTSGKNLAVTASDGASLTGGKNVSVSAGTALDLTGGTTADLSGGSDMKLTAGKNATIRSGVDLALIGGKKGSFTTGDTFTLRSAKDTVFDIGKSLNTTVAEALDVRTKKTTLTSSGTTTIKSKDIVLQGSGKIDVKANGDLTLKGSKIKENR
jgi:type VI secretion system secreted protein VgrG